MNISKVIFSTLLFLKTFRSEACKETRYSFIPVDVCEVRETKACFKKFLRACLPTAPTEYNEATVNHHSNHHNFGFYKQIQESKWFENVIKNFVNFFFHLTICNT